MKYAVNVSDMTKDVILSNILFAPYVNGRTDVEPGKIDGIAAVLNIEDKEQWEGIKFIVRKKYNKNEFRLYELNEKRWKKV